MPTAWIVAADSSSCRIFSADKPAGPLHELEALARPLRARVVREVGKNMTRLKPAALRARLPKRL
jgi:hypothetical protein